MTSGLAKESEMVTILTIHRIHSPWGEQEVLGGENFPGELGEVGVSRSSLPVSYHLEKSPVIGTQLVSLKLIKEKGNKFD